MATKTVTYTAYADFEIRDANGDSTPYKTGEVFTPPANWKPLPNNDPTPAGEKFSVPGEYLKDEQGGREQQFRTFILPLTKS